MKIMPSLRGFARRKATWFAVLVGMITAIACWRYLPTVPRRSLHVSGWFIGGGIVFSPDFHFAAESFKKWDPKGDTFMTNLWDLNEGRVLFSFPFEQGNLFIRKVAISPDNEILVEFKNGLVTFYKIPTGEKWKPPIQFSDGPEFGKINHLAIDAQGRIFVVHSEKLKPISVHDLFTGKKLGSLPNENPRASFFPGGVLWFDRDKELFRVRKIPSGEFHGEINLPKNPPIAWGVSSAGISSDCNTIVVVETNLKTIQGMVRIWNVPTSNYRLLVFPDGIESSRFFLSPNGQFVALHVFRKSHPNPVLQWILPWIKPGPEYDEWILYDLDNEKELISFPSKNFNYVQFSLDGKSFAVRYENRLDLYHFPLPRPWTKIFGFASLAGALAMLLSCLLGFMYSKQCFQITRKKIFLAIFILIILTGVLIIFDPFDWPLTKILVNWFKN
jgi:WD40 repeat protein